MDHNQIDMANKIFPIGPDWVELYPAAGQKLILAALQQDVAAGRHLLCLTGPAGSGKTVLLRALRQSFRQGLIGMIENPAPGRLLIDVAQSLQLDTEDVDETGLRRRLVMLLAMADQQQQPIIQIVDAADRLSPEDINLLLHFFPPGHATLVLAGIAAPETWLTGCATTAGDVRIDHCYHLEPLAAEETAAYIRHRLRAAALQNDLFPPATLAAIHQRSGGLPGRINKFSAEMLGQSLERESSGDLEAPTETVVSPDEIADFPRAPACKICTPKGTATTVFERRRRAEPPVRPIVAPHDVHYEAERLSWRMRRLRRGVRLWRAAAILGGVSLAGVLTHDVWLEHTSSSRSLLSSFAELLDESRVEEQAVHEPAQSMSLDVPALPAEVSGTAGANSDFAALQEPPIVSGNNEAPPAPRKMSETPPQPAYARSAPAAPESVPKPRADQPAAASVNDAEMERRNAGKVTAESRPERKAPSLLRAQRQEIARLYAERAEYEWRNGDLDAAGMSIQRGLATDPNNPRLLQMRALLRGLIQQP